MGFLDFLGGGGSKSSSKASIDTSLAVSALASSVMSCTSNTSVLQTFVISGNYNVVKNTKQVQALKFSASCEQSAQNMADLQAKVANAIANSAEATGSGILSMFGASKSEAETNIKNNVSQEIKQETIQNIVNNSSAQQELIISGNNNIVDNFAQEQTMEIVLKNCQDVVNSLKVVQDMNNALQQQSKAVTTNPFAEIIDSIGNVLQGIGWMWVIIIVAIIAGSVFVGPRLLSIFLGQGDPNKVQPTIIQQNSPGGGPQPLPVAV